MKSRDTRIRIDDLPLRTRKLDMDELGHVFGGGMATHGSVCSDDKDCGSGRCRISTRSAWKVCCCETRTPNCCTAPGMCFDCR